VAVKASKERENTLADISTSRVDYLLLIHCYCVDILTDPEYRRSGQAMTQMDIEYTGKTFQTDHFTPYRVTIQ